MTATITGDQTGTVGLINAKTAVASTSGTSIDFTGIPAGVKRITVMFSGVSTNGTSIPQIQLGTSSGFEVTGYYGAAAATVASAVGVTNYTSGVLINNGNNSAATYSGAVTILNMSTNTFVFNGVVARSDTNSSATTSGVKALSGTLDRVRITTVNGTDTFDTGSINILYE